MKNLICMLAISAAFVLSACGNNGNNNTPPNGTVAAVPQACGTSIPSQYCTTYNTSAYGSYPYSTTYGTYGYGYYNSGYYVPYSTGSYGCPVGYQPFYTGSYYSGAGYTCVAVNYMSSFGYQPYYSSYGSAQACDAYTNSCPAGLRCRGFSSRVGFCSY